MRGDERDTWSAGGMLGLCVYTFSICRIFDAGVKGLKWKARVPRSRCSTRLRASGKHEDFKIIFACLLLLGGLQTQNCIQPLRPHNFIKLNAIYNHYPLINLNFSNQNKYIITGNHLKGLTASIEHVLWILARFIRHLCQYGLSLRMPNICHLNQKVTLYAQEPCKREYLSIPVWLTRRLLAFCNSHLSENLFSS